MFAMSEGAAGHDTLSAPTCEQPPALVTPAGDSKEIRPVVGWIVTFSPPPAAPVYVIDVALPVTVPAFAVAGMRSASVPTATAARPETVMTLTVLPQGPAAQVADEGVPRHRYSA